MHLLIFIIALAVLILVHEFGHFSMAKLFGIKVSEFGLGLPPKLWGKKIGETEYTLNALPFGGFVKIFGEDPHTEDVTPENRARSMYYQAKWKQACVLLAGIGMNIIFAWLLISLGYVVGLPSPVDHEGLGTVENVHVVVIDTLPSSPAATAGLQSGDQISSLSSGNTTLRGANITLEHVSDLISQSTGNVTLSYIRGNAPAQTVTLTPVENAEVGARAIGIAMDEVGTLRLSPALALIQGANTTWQMISETAIGLAVFLKNIITLHSDFSQVAGPVGIAHAAGQAQDLGFVYFLSLVALISINLAVLNLVPFPALDGGRLLFVLIEAVIRRPIKPSVVRWVNAIGFAILIILMVVITAHDIFKLL